MDINNLNLRQIKVIEVLYKLSVNDDIDSPNSFEFCVVKDDGYTWIDMKGDCDGLKRKGIMNFEKIVLTGEEKVEDVFNLELLKKHGISRKFLEFIRRSNPFELYHMSLKPKGKSHYLINIIGENGANAQKLS